MPETFRTRFDDVAREYRSAAFRAYIDTPPRSFKESPTTREYVDVTEEELASLLIPDSTETQVQEIEGDVAIVDSRVVVKNGHGAYVSGLKETLADNPGMIPEAVLSATGKDRAEYLINSCWENGAFMRVDDSTHEFRISVTETSNRKSLALKSVIVVGNDCNVDIDYRCVSDSATGSVHGKTLYLFIGRRSRVNFTYLQEKSSSVTDLTFVRSFLSDYAEFRIFHVNRGSLKTIFSNESLMEGDGSDFRTFGVSFSDGVQRMDIRDSSFQTGKSTYADIQVRGAVSGGSVTMHRGNIDIEEQSVLSNGFYDSRILLLSKDGYANSKPGLIIRNSNTRSKHGSAISSIDEEQVLYLQSRGIGKKLARSMITEGFLGFSVEKSGNEFLMGKVHEFAQALISND